jgi:hypothetical protein
MGLASAVFAGSLAIRNPPLAIWHSANRGFGRLANTNGDE